MARPRTVTGLGIVLIAVTGLTLMNLARGILGYFQSGDDGGSATRVSVVEFLLLAPMETLVPTVIGILSGIAAVGVFRGRRWSQILAIGVGAASIVGGVMLSMPAIVEWGMPGSFALLLLPGAVIAFVIGAYVLYAALVNRAYFHR